MTKAQIAKSTCCSLLPCALVALLSFAADGQAQARGRFVDKLFTAARGHGGPTQPSDPLAPAPPRDRLVPPPGENPYFSIREDMQPYVVRTDTSVNLTEAMNRFYYDPRWRGEVLGPFDTFTLVERATRMLGTWREYNELSEFRVGNGVNQTLERYSGFGP